MLIVRNLICFFIFQQFIWTNAYYNPFLIEKQEVDSIANLIISDQQAGFKTKPKRNGIVYFDLLDKDNQKIYSPEFNPVSFRLIKKNKTYLMEVKISYQNNKYRAQIILPKVESPGWYDLQIKIAGQEKYYKNAFQYLDDKFNLIFLIDNSLSMLKSDPQKKRFQAIKKIVSSKKFSEKIHGISVIEFSNKSKVLVPFTTLLEFLKKEWINTIIPLGDTNFTAGLNAVQRVLQKAKSSYRKNVVIFLSDGITNYPYNDEHKALLKNNASVFTIGFKEKSKNLDSRLLRRIALETNGIYQEGDSSFIEKIYQKIIIESLIDNKDIVIYPMKEIFSKNELVSLRYSSLWEEINVQVKIDNEIVTPLLKEELIIFPPLKSGRYDIMVAFFHKNKRVRNFVKTIIISDTLPSIAINFPLIIDYKKSLANQISFFDVFSSEFLDYLNFNLLKETKNEFHIMENFNFLESPFFLKEKEKKKVGITFDASFLSAEEGGDNYLLLAQTAKSYYAYEVNFSPIVSKKLKETDKNFQDDKFFEQLLIIIFLMLGLITFYFLYWRGKHNS